MTIRVLPIEQIQPNLVPQRRLVVAEIAQGHDGSLGAAHAYIDAVADAGADAVKFQTHIAEAESTPSEPWRVEFSRQDDSRYDYWKRMEFSEPQWEGLRAHAEERGLFFLSSPFSLEAVRLLKRVGVAGWKVASGELSDGAMLKEMLATGWPLLLSTGMSTFEEMDAVVAAVQRAAVPLVVLQCTSSYPTPAEGIGLNLLPLFRERYSCAVGLSDHSGEIYPSLAAVTLGAAVVEVHVVFDRASFGPDVPASVTFDELADLVAGVRFLERALSHPVDKDAMAAELAPMRSLFNKSIVAREDLPAGTVLAAEHLALKKPGTGLPAEHVPRLIGRMLKCAVVKDQLLRDDDVESGRAAVAGEREDGPGRPEGGS